MLKPLYLLSDHLAICLKASLLCYNINGDHMASSGCSGPIFLVVSLEVVGRDTVMHVGALVPVIYMTRARVRRP
jgi:hypothetical protein